MDLVFCIFIYVSDYEYSCESLVGIFPTHSEAETALLTHIQRAEEFHKKEAAFSQRKSESSRKIWLIHAKAEKKEQDTKVPQNDKKRQKATKLKMALASEEIEVKLARKELDDVLDEYRTWRESLGYHDSIADPNLDKYEIRPVELGKIL